MCLSTCLFIYVYGRLFIGDSATTRAASGAEIKSQIQVTSVAHMQIIRRIQRPEPSAAPEAANHNVNQNINTFARI